MTDQLSQDLASLKIDRSAPPRRSVRGLLAIVVFIAAAVAVVAFVIVPKITGAFGGTEVKTDTIRMVSPAQASVQLTATGYVVAEVYAKVASKVPGRIAELYVQEGKVIEKGDKVARLEDVDAKSALAASRARAGAARSRIGIARGQYAELKVQIEREKPLVAKGVTAKATLDDLEARAASLLASVRSSEAEAMASDAEANSLDVQQGNFIVTSPIRGTVIDKLVEVGEGVSPGFGTPGVVEVVDLDSVIMEVDVPENRMSQVTETSPCEIVLDAYPSTRLAGRVKESGWRINKSKATIPVKVEFTAPPDQRLAKIGDEPPKKMKILPDMAGRVNFLGATLDPKSLDVPPKRVVPTKAITQRDGKDVVFIFDEGTIRMRSVVVKGEFGGGRELESDIPEKTKVVIDPPADLHDGQKVREITK